MNKINNFRTVAINYVYNVGYQIFRIIVPIITIPYVSRVLGPHNLGVQSYTYSIATYFALFAYLGFGNYGSRLVAQNRDNQEKLNYEFTSAYLFQIITSFIAIICYIAFVFFLNNTDPLVAWIQVLYIVSEMFNVTWLYFGLELFKFTAIRSFFIRLISAIAIFAFIKRTDDLPLYAGICAASSFISVLVLWVGMQRYVRFVRVKWKDIVKHFKGCLILFVPVLVIVIYRTMGQVMLGNLSTMSEVAIYTNADKVAEIPYGLIASLGVIMLPRMTFLVSKGDEERSKMYIEACMRFMMFCACPMAFGLLGAGKVFAPVFFGEKFAACGLLIMVISPMIIIRACANVVRTQYLLPHERDKDYINSIFIGVIVNIVLNLLLIPKYESLGAAIATLFCESLVAFYQIWICRKNIPVFQYIYRNWFFILAGFMMFVPMYVIGEMYLSSIKILIIQILVGCIIYLLLGGTYIMKHEKILVQRLLKR